MGVHIYTNGAWTDSGKIYRNSENICTYDNIEGIINNLPYKNDLVFENINQGTYTISYDLSTDAEIAYATSIGIGETTYSRDLQTISGSPSGRINITFTISPEDAGKNIYARFVRAVSSFTANYSASNIMLNTGATPHPYEPYDVVDWYTNTGHNYSSGAWS